MGPEKSTCIKQYRARCSKVITALAIVGCASTSVSASTFYQFDWNGGGHSQAGGKINSITSTFAPSTNRLTWESTFAAAPSSPSHVTNGFWLVVNAGPNPKGHAGELAIFYLDASNSADLKLSVYAYNGVNGPNSWRDGSPAAGLQTPDRITNSIANPSFINSLTFEDHGNGTRTIGFDIDATAINQHVPLHPGPDGPSEWTGAAYDDLIGIWFHPVRGLSAGYDQNGWLTSWGFEAQGWLDTTNMSTTLIVPLPPAAWAGLAMLGGIVGVRKLRRR